MAAEHEAAEHEAARPKEINTSAAAVADPVLKPHIMIDGASIGNYGKDAWGSEPDFYNVVFFPQIEKAVLYYNMKGYHVDVIYNSL